MSKSASTETKTMAVIGYSLMFIGVVCNKWILAALFSDDGVLNFGTRITIWIFDLFLLSIGMIVLFKRKSLAWKQLIFGLISLFMMLIMVELGLHLVYIISKSGDAGDNIDRSLLSPYEGKVWAQDLFKEDNSTKLIFEQYIGWRRIEYRGKYVNVDPSGVRRTWNPDSFRVEKVDTLYVFGGSTIWGTGARDDYTIPSSLSKILANEGYNYSVYNYGETGRTFTQEIIHLTLLLREGHRPKVCCFYDGVNDVYGAYQSGIAGTVHNLFDLRRKLQALQEQKARNTFKGRFRMFAKSGFSLVAESSMIYEAIGKIPIFFSSQSQQVFQETGAKYRQDEIQKLSAEIVEYYQ